MPKKPKRSRDENESAFDLLQKVIKKSEAKAPAKKKRTKPTR